MRFPVFAAVLGLLFATLPAARSAEELLAPSPEQYTSESAEFEPSTFPPTTRTGQSLSQALVMPDDLGAAGFSMPGGSGCTSCNHGRVGPCCGGHGHCRGCAHCGGCVGCGLFCDDGLPCPWETTCNLVPHTPYYMKPKTYYYFRPYNWAHVWQQSEWAASWGGDPRHPYANEVFERVYRQLEEAQPLPSPMQNESPFKDEPAVQGASHVSPAPVSVLSNQQPLHVRMTRFFDGVLGTE